MKEALREPLHESGVRSDQGVNAANGGKKLDLSRNAVDLNYRRLGRGGSDGEKVPRCWALTAWFGGEIDGLVFGKPRS